MSGTAVWWQGLSRRERRLLGLLGVVAAPALLWLAVLRPLAAAALAADARAGVAADDLARMEALAPALAARPKAVPALAEGIEAALARAGLAASSLDLAGQQQATLRIAAARAPVLLAMMADLEARGLQVARASISRNEDATVSAELVVATPGGAP
jgi:general secretion pathway protein M